MIAADSKLPQTINWVNFTPKNVSTTLSTFYGGTRNFSKKNLLLPGFNYRKKFSLSNFIADSIFDIEDWFVDDFKNEVVTPNNVDDPSLDEIYGSYSKSSPLTSNTKRKRKRRYKPGSDRRARVWWKKVKECRKDVNQVYLPFKVGHLSEIEAKLMLRPTFALLNFLGASPIDDT